MNTSYKLASREYQEQDSIVRVKDVLIGGRSIVFMAGPCTVEDRTTLMDTASAVRQAGAHILRGGAFKTRTSPYGFQGLGEEGLKLLAEAGRQFRMPVVTEIIDSKDINMICEYADMLQIGSRNMQNTALLKTVGKQKLPVLLKRGFANTIDEWLSAAEYILAEGNDQVVLCERGVRNFETRTRFSLDLLSVPLIKKISHLPIIVDPSHAAGQRDLVIPMARAAIAAGADGLLVEVNINPEKAIVDGYQTLDTAQFKELARQVSLIADAVDRSA